VPIFGAKAHPAESPQQHAARQEPGCKPFAIPIKYLHVAIAVHAKAQDAPVRTPESGLFAPATGGPNGTADNSRCGVDRQKQDHRKTGYPQKKPGNQHHAAQTGAHSEFS
jgi:hypothetical protein